MQNSPAKNSLLLVRLPEAETEALQTWLQRNETQTRLRGVLSAQDTTDFTLNCEVIEIQPAVSEAKITATAADQAKLDALTIVAQGMGHEINNPLQIIMGNVELLMALAPDAALQSPLRDIFAAGERIKAVVANLKDFIQAGEQ